MRGLRIGAAAVVAALLGAGLLGASARQVQASRLGARATCASATKALHQFKKSMGASKKRFFRRHPSARARRAYVKRQSATLKALQRRAAAACRPPQGAPPPAPPAPPAPPPPPADPDPDHDGYAAPSDCAPNDPAIHPGAPDAPDLGFVDSNCDGIDGDESRAIFVAPGGDDRNDGTKHAPKRTVAGAIVVAAGKDVYVAAGTYDEGTGLALVSGVGVYGGYDAVTWARAQGAATTIRGAPVAILADGDTGVTLQLLTLEGMSAGSSAYGIRAGGSSLTLEEVKIEARAGAPGAPGAAFGAAAANGAAGSRGVNGYEDDSYFYCVGNMPDPPPFTPAGTNPGDATANGGNGGRGAITNGSAAAGTSGQTSPRGPAGGIGVSGGAGNPGANGASGSNGSNGTAGAPGYGPTGFAPTAGALATNGTPGTGGGGGAGGGSVHSTGTCNDWGGSGGSGGAGGAGGAGGRGGTSGGGSFGIYAWNSTIVLTGCSVTAGNGGQGGNGGLGQEGGSGAPGGAGGSGYDEGQAGGAGGRGGDGGDGGRGGAGAGGPSIAIVLGGGSSAPRTSTTLAHGVAGVGGLPNGTSGRADDVYAP
jgi:hypothetical protein